MRYPASEKLEIIRLVEQSHLPVRRTLEKLAIPRATFYHWYDLYRSGGPGSPGRSSFTAGAGVEPHPRSGEGADCQPGSGRAHPVAAGAGGALHRYGKVLCLRGFGLSAAEGP